MASSKEGIAALKSPALKCLTPSLNARTAAGGWAFASSMTAPALAASRPAAPRAHRNPRAARRREIPRARSNIEASLFFAFITGADLPEVIVAVNARTMPIAPAEVKGVIADHFDGARRDLPGHLRILHAAFMGPLIDAGGAAAGQAQIPAVVAAVMLVAPENAQLPAGGFNFFGDRVQNSVSIQGWGSTGTL